VPFVVLRVELIDSLDQPVYLKPLDRLVKLPGVDLPRRAKPLLQAIAQLIAVGGPVKQQSQQCVLGRYS
jgi:hypothetical protein